MLWGIYATASAETLFSFIKTDFVWQKFYVSNHSSIRPPSSWFCRPESSCRGDDPAMWSLEIHQEDIACLCVF